MYIYMYVYIYTYTYIQFFDRQETMYCMLCFLSTLQAPGSPQTEPVLGVDLCSFTDDCYMVAKVHLLRLPTRARKPLGVYPIGLRSSSCSATKGTPPPWTTYVPIEVNTRQVDGLARIFFLFVFCCYTATQPALQLQQGRTQVVCSKRTYRLTVWWLDLSCWKKLTHFLGVATTQLAR